jgi:hypothetical protein
MNGGLLVVPFDGKNWVRIGMFFKKPMFRENHDFSKWFENEVLEEVTII